MDATPSVGRRLSYSSKNPAHSLTDRNCLPVVLPETWLSIRRSGTKRGVIGIGHLAFTSQEGKGCGCSFGYLKCCENLSDQLELRRTAQTLSLGQSLGTLKPTNFLSCLPVVSNAASSFKRRADLQNCLAQNEYSTGQNEWM